MAIWLKVTGSRLRALAQKGRLDDDFEQELEAHVALLAEDNVRRGMSPGEARRAAVLRVGSAASLKAQHRDARGFPLIDALRHDVAFAFRLIGRTPWFSAAAILTLSLGIGINAMGFTVINGAFLRGLPFDRSEQLHMLSWQTRAGRRDEVSIQDLRDWRRQSRTFAGFAGFAPAAMNLSDTRSAPEQTRGAWVTANTFGLLRQAPLFGRDFTSADEGRNEEAAVIISSRLWRSRYGRDPAVLGAAVRLNGQAATIVGVMPEGLTFPDVTDVWAPFVPTDVQDQRGAHILSVFGRLQDGASLKSAQAELNGIGRQLIAAYPADTSNYSGVRVETFNDALVGGPARTMFLVMMGAVCFVLLIACANVANLLLSRSVHRSREVALRIAVGATRGRVVAQLLVESVVLGLLGGGLGLVLTVAGVRVFDTAVPSVGRPFFMTFTVDYVVFGYVAGVCLLAAVLFGLSPALQVSRANSNDVLKEGGRGGVGGQRARRLSGVLVVAELALTVVLLSGAGLMLRSFLNVYSMNLGIATDRLMAMSLQLPEPRYASADARRTFFERLEPLVASIPGVDAVATTTGVPPFDGGERLIEIDGRPADRGSRFVSIVTISPRFFDVVDAPLVRGRRFEPADGTPGRETAIVNVTLAARDFSDEDPIGRRIRVTRPGSEPGVAEPTWHTIVGVSPAIRHGSVRDSEANPVVYLPFAGETPASTSLLVRSRLAPAAVMQAVRGEVQDIDPDQPVEAIRTLEEMLADARWAYRAFGGMFALFGVVALVLSAVGLYGVMAYAVTQRTQEIGVRMALGATRANVSWMVLKRGLTHLAMGLAIGLAGALALSGVLNRVLVEISPADPITYGAIVLILSLVAVTACVLPARRATVVDPTAALRAE